MPSPLARAITAALARVGSPYAQARAGVHEAATSPWNARKPPTPAQQRAGNYAKGRAVWQGLKIAIENPAGTTRSGTDPSGKAWSSTMAADYGEFSGTRGADGDPVDVFLGPYPESQRVWIVNALNADRSFDEHKVLAGFADRRHAEDSYRLSYMAGWDRYLEPVEVSLDQLKWWLKFGDHAIPFSLDLVPPEPDMTDTDTPELTRVFWDHAAEPAGGRTLSDVLYQIRVHDSGEGLLLDSLTMADILEESGTEVMVLDALIVEAGRLKPAMAAMERALNNAGTEIKPLAMQISEPLKRLGGVHVAVIFELSDGQTITVWFHNPDTTPARFSPADNLVSWKWQLNKKDITIVVAPEKGVDLNAREVARRVMKLAQKNSAAFAKANAKRAETMQVIADLKAAIPVKQAQLQGLMGQIEAAKAAKVEAAPKAWNDRRLDPTTPQGYATVVRAGNDALRMWQDTLDPLFTDRIFAVRNALVAAGWTVDDFSPQSLRKTIDGFDFMVGLVPDNIGAGKNMVGLTVKVKMNAFFLGSISDDLTQTPEQIAAAADALAVVKPGWKYEPIRVGERWRVAGAKNGNPISPAYPDYQEALGAIDTFVATGEFPEPSDQGEMQSWRVTNTEGYSSLKQARTMIRAIQEGMAEVDYTLPSNKWQAVPEAAAEPAATPAAPEVYAFPDASDEAKGLLAIGARKGGKGAYTTAVAIDRNARGMGLSVRWEATDTLPTFDSAKLDKAGDEAKLEPSGATPQSRKVEVNQFEAGDKVVSLDDNKDYTVAAQRGHQVTLKGKAGPVTANRLKLASGAKPKRVVLDSADVRAAILASAAEAAAPLLPKGQAVQLDSVDAAIVTLGIALSVVENNEPISRAEGNIEQADLQAANAAQFREAIALLKGGRLDDATGGLFGDGDSGYIVGTLSRNSVDLATVHLRDDGDGITAWTALPALKKMLEESAGSYDPVAEEVAAVVEGGWTFGEGEAVTAMATLARENEAYAAENAAAMAEEEKARAEKAAALAADEARRDAMLKAAADFGAGKAGFAGAVVYTADGVAVKAALTRKPLGSFAFAVAPMSGDAWGVIVFSRQIVGKGGRVIDPEGGKPGTVQVTRTMVGPAEAYAQAVETLAKAGGTLPGMGPVSLREAMDALDSLGYALDDLQGHTETELARAGSQNRLQKADAAVRALISRGWPEKARDPVPTLRAVQRMLDRAAELQARGGPDMVGRGDALSYYLNDPALTPEQVAAILAKPAEVIATGNGIDVPRYRVSDLKEAVSAAIASNATKGEAAGSTDEPQQTQPAGVTAQAASQTATPADAGGPGAEAGEPDAGAAALAAAEASRVAQRTADLATLATVAAGTHPDMLEPELADELERILLAYPGDKEIETAAESALNAYQSGALAATA